MIQRRVPLRRSAPPPRNKKPIARKTRVRKRKRGTLAGLRKQAEKLCELITKRNAGYRCYFAADSTFEVLLEGKPHVCAGTLQAAHGFGKKAHPSVRYELMNLFALCGRAHAYYTWQPHRWDRFLRQAWGEPVYEEMYRLACKTVKLDMPAIVSKLRAEWEQSAPDEKAA